MPEKQKNKRNKSVAKANSGRNEKGYFLPGHGLKSPGRPPVAQSLVNRIREMGKELIHSKDGQTVMSRLDVLLLRAWNDAMAGNKDARQFIVERGWGKVALPINMQNVSDELEQKAIELGIAIEQHQELAVIIGAARAAEHRAAIVESISSGEKPN